jgi:hypothetical protein
MATQARGKKPASKTGGSGSDFYIPPLPVAVVPVRKSVGEEIVGWIFCCILIACLLPLGAMLYLDILEVKQQVKQEVNKVERLRREVERERREKKPSDTISDNPVFDRVRRPFSLPLPRPDKLE